MPVDLTTSSARQRTSAAHGLSPHLRTRHRCARAAIVIPARLSSSRLPRKLLLRETGKTVLQHTYEAAGCSRRALSVTVAADHQELIREVEAFGGSVVPTRVDHASGTDRVAEVARSLGDADIIVNVQGDEPEISGEAIDQVIELLDRDPEAVMATLATPIRDRARLLDPACVKVVCDEHGRAMTFSRAPVPYAREWDDALLAADPPIFLQHIGMYAYRRDFLIELASWLPSRLELVERLEQLRVLEAGFSISVGLVQEATRGIDTPEDYEAFVDRMTR